MKGMRIVADIKYEIKETLGILSENNRGWSKEVNLISWNDRSQSMTSETGHLNMRKWEKV